MVLTYYVLFLLLIYLFLYSFKLLIFFLCFWQVLSSFSISFCIKNCRIITRQKINLLSIFFFVPGGGGFKKFFFFLPKAQFQLIIYFLLLFLSFVDFYFMGSIALEKQKLFGYKKIIITYKFLIFCFFYLNELRVKNNQVLVIFNQFA